MLDELGSRQGVQLQIVVSLIVCTMFRPRFFVWYISEFWSAWPGPNNILRFLRSHTVEKAMTSHETIQDREMKSAETL